MAESLELKALLHRPGAAPDWRLGLLLGLGGMAGMYLGARCQKHVPATALKYLSCWRAFCSLQRPAIWAKLSEFRGTTAAAKDDHDHEGYFAAARGPV